MASPTRTVGEVLKQHLRTKGWSSTQLTVALNNVKGKPPVSLATVRAYLQNARTPNSDQIRRIASAIYGKQANGVEDLISELQAARSAVEARRSEKPVTSEQLAAPGSSLRIAPLHYAPMEELLRGLINRLLKLMSVQAEWIEMPFNVKRRNELLWDKAQAELSDGLCSLNRMHLLDWHTTPLRISLNGVALADQVSADNLTRIQEALAGKTTHLAAMQGLCVITVPMEVGDLHARQTGSAIEIRTVTELNASALAQRLKECAEEFRGTETIPVVWCNEIIALQVAEHLGEFATLVFPLSTTANIRHSEYRRELPAYLAGIAVSRKATDVVRTLEKAVPLLLETEIETTAKLWQNSFENTVTLVAKLVSKNNSVVAGGSARDREASAQRAGREYALRAFRLTREMVESFEHSSLPWKPILRRARTLLQEQTARDRGKIRARVLDVLSAFLGLTLDDVREHANEFLLPFSNNIEFQQDLLTALMQEFDITLSVKIFRDYQRLHLELLVSVVQRALEQEGGRSSAVYVMEARPAQLDQLRRLYRQFEASVQVPSEVLSDEDLNRYLSSPLEADNKQWYAESGQVEAVNKIPQTHRTRELEAEAFRTFVATYARQMAGFIMLTKRLGDEDCHLEKLFVRHEARHRGVGAQLVRRGLETAADTNASKVRIEADKFSPADTLEQQRLYDLLRAEGFTRHTGNRFIYEITGGKM